MKLFKRHFAKSRNTGFFSIVFPQAPAGLRNREFLKAQKGCVYACVRMIANEIGTAEFQPQKYTSGHRSRVNKRPALELLANVNPFLTYDGSLRATSLFLDLTGNACLVGSQ